LEFEDFGTFSSRDSDYNSFAESGAKALERGEVDYLFGSCSSGQGVNLAAQSYPWVLGALIYDEDSAEYAVRHNGANFFSFPERLWLDNMHGLEACIGKIVNNSFDGGRHQGRVMSVLAAKGTKGAIS
jgi:RpiB/LacA/LacB family sugar-phosphate isomerase